MVQLATPNDGILAKVLVSYLVDCFPFNATPLNDMLPFSFRCVALDQRGYNESEKPQDIDQYQLKHLVSDVHGLIEHLGKKKIILVCHDWGSVVGFEYVMFHCDTVDKYILMSAPPRQIHRELSQTNEEQSRMSWYLYFLQTPIIPEMVMRAFDMKMLEEMSPNGDDSTSEVYKYVFGKPGAFTPPINYYRANVFSATPKPPSPESSLIPPGLLLLAENDKFISKDCGPVAERRIANLKYVLLKNTDHFCQQNNPTLVNYEMQKFLDGTQ